MKSGEFYTVQDGMCGVQPSEPTEIPLRKCIQVIRNATILDLVSSPSRFNFWRKCRRWTGRSGWCWQDL